MRRSRSGAAVMMDSTIVSSPTPGKRVASVGVQGPRIRATNDLFIGKEVEATGTARGIDGSERRASKVLSGVFPQAIPVDKSHSGRRGASVGRTPASGSPRDTGVCGP